MTARESFTKSARLRRAIVGLLLALVFFVPFFSARHFGPITDEVPHLAAGYSYWKTGEITLNRQHPPLVKLLAAVPMLFMDLKFNPADLALGQWLFGERFLFSNDIDRILAWVRLVPMFLSVLLGYFVFRWTRDLFHSDWTGILALVIYAFMPNIIAHAQFVATDLAVAAFSFIAMYWLWKRNFLAAGLFLGLALATKFSALLLLPIAAAAAGLRWRRIALLFLMALAVLYVVYLFPGNLDFYLDGYRALYEDRSPTYQYYLNGEYSPDGFWQYFLVAFLIKTPIPFLIGLALAVVSARKFNFDRRTNLFLWGTPLLFFLAATFKAENIGVRYLLPMYPFLIVLVSGAIGILYQKLKIKSQKFLIFEILFLILAGWYVFSAISLYPDYLAYFNEFVGGPRNGYKHLDDSNVEWGQDVKRLAAYQREHPGTKAVYSWNAIDERVYGVSDNQMRLPAGQAGRKDEWWRNPSGRYAVNVFFLTRARIASRVKNQPELDWLSRYQPIDRIGYSYFVYEFQ